MTHRVPPVGGRNVIHAIIQEGPKKLKHPLGGTFGREMVRVQAGAF